MVIAIDGPSGAGKSTVARALAQRLGISYLDTGAMFRAVAYVSKQTGRSAAEIAADGQIQISGDRIFYDGEELTNLIRTPEISDLASKIATSAHVREGLKLAQRKIVASGDWIADGRDIGTVVAPDAELKIYLDASADERARRRAAELGLDPRVVLIEQLERDRQDSTRDVAPLRQADDAIKFDSTGLSIDEVITKIAELVNERRQVSP